jgi:gamma-glutamyltranspeptidase/glutathione hydrolase
MSALVAAMLMLVSALPARAASGWRGVVAAEHRLASAAGIAILRQGGNAVDAAVATALAVCVVNPTSCGIGGGGFMVIFERRRGRVFALDYREAAPAAATRDLFVRDGAAVPALSVRGGLAVAVPGEIAGLDAALRRFGTLPFAVVAAPAIAYARDGFPIGAHLAESIAAEHERLRARPPLAALLLRPDGAPRQAGDTLRQPALAATLERIAREGPAAFYTGPVADAIVASAGESGGILSRLDLAAYRPVWRTPLRGRFRGYDVYGMPPPSSGGGVLIEALNLLHADDLRALEHNSATYLHLLAEAMQLGFADRATFYGDPDHVRVPLADLLALPRATSRRRRLSAATTFSPAFYGAAAGRDDAGTSHLSVIDAAGNAVACTTSINTAFGSMVLAGDTGIILNNTMDDFSARPGVPHAYGLVGSHANAIAPRKRPLSSMTPTIVLRDGEVVAVAGGSGGPLIISATLQVLLNALGFDQDAATAVAAPRIHHQWLPPVLLVQPGIPPAVRHALGRAGHRIVEMPRGAAVQLARRAADGRLDGAADPRKGGEALILQ